MGIALPFPRRTGPSRTNAARLPSACSPHPDGSTDAAARLLEQALLSRGATVDRICLREYAIHPASLRLLFRTPGALRL